MRILLRFFYILCAGLATGFLHYTFAGSLPEWTLWMIKFLLPALFWALWFLPKKFGKESGFSRSNLPFFIMNLGLLVTFLIASRLESLFDLNTETAEGLAGVKLNECIIFSLTAIIAARFCGLRYKDLFLSRGKLWLGLAIGFPAFTGMILLGLIQPGVSTISVEFLLRFAPWLLIFVLANGFMEELMFRGLFLKQLDLKPWAANLVVTLFFTAAHMTVTYTPDILQFLAILLVLSWLWGWIMQKTHSMIASVLFHAGADVVIMYGVFSSFGITT